VYIIFTSQEAVNFVASYTTLVLYLKTCLFVWELQYFEINITIHSLLRENHFLLEASSS